jgi:hypothetical protein
MSVNIFEDRWLRVSLWLFLSLALLDTISYVQVAHDDIYIFYTYARNIAAGDGYVFNLGVAGPDGGRDRARPRGFAGRKQVGATFSYNF